MKKYFSILLCIVYKFWQDSEHIQIVVCNYFWYVKDKGGGRFAKYLLAVQERLSAPPALYHEK